TPEIHWVNCVYKGRSKPSSSRNSAFASSEASSPSNTVTGSPGVRWASKNTTTATTKKIGINCNKRWIVYLSNFYHPYPKKHHSRLDTFHSIGPIKSEYPSTSLLTA